MKFHFAGVAQGKEGAAAVKAEATMACSSSSKRLPSTCSASVVSGQTLSKEIGMMFLSLVAILALDCHADQRGADADSKLSIKLKLKFSLETLWRKVPS